MSGPRHGQSLWFWSGLTVALLPAIAVGVAIDACGQRRNSFAALSESARGEIAALNVVPARTDTEERGWMRIAAPAGELMSPLGPKPCTPAWYGLPVKQQVTGRDAFKIRDLANEDERIRGLVELTRADPTNLLVALITAQELVSVGDFKNAEQIADSALASTELDTDILRGARKPERQVDAKHQDVATVIHLHHTWGVAQLLSGANAPWIALKNVIGSVRMLSQRASLGRLPDEAPESKLTIFVPGCGRSEPRPLNSYDIYNNLIVGYMGGGFANTDTREREFARTTTHRSSALRRLLRALVDNRRATQPPDKTQSGWRNESELWALSNAESVLDARSERPDNARLAFNIVRLIDWWMDPQRCPAVICSDALQSALSVEREALLRDALRYRNDIDKEQRQAFAIGILQMLAESSTRPAAIADDLNSIREWLAPEQQQVVDDLFAAEKALQDLPEWVVQPNKRRGAEPWEPLGTRAKAWREAALHDFSTDLAVWAKDRPESERKHVVAAIRRLYAPMTTTPEIAALLPNDHFWFDVFTNRWAWIMIGAAAGLALWVLFVWILLQYREYRLLRISFYELELDYIDNSGVPRQRR